MLVIIANTNINCRMIKNKSWVRININVINNNTNMIWNKSYGKRQIMHCYILHTSTSSLFMIHNSHTGTTDPNINKIKKIKPWMWNKPVNRKKKEYILQFLIFLYIQKLTLAIFKGKPCLLPVLLHVYVLGCCRL